MNYLLILISHKLIYFILQTFKFSLHEILIIENTSHLIMQVLILLLQFKIDCPSPILNMHQLILLLFNFLPNNILFQVYTLKITNELIILLLEGLILIDNSIVFFFQLKILLLDFIYFSFLLPTEFLSLVMYCLESLFIFTQFLSQLIHYSPLFNDLLMQLPFIILPLFALFNLCVENMVLLL